MQDAGAGAFGDHQFALLGRDFAEIVEHPPRVEGSHDDAGQHAIGAMHPGAKPHHRQFGQRDGAQLLVQADVGDINLPFATHHGGPETVPGVLVVKAVFTDAHHTDEGAVDARHLAPLGVQLAGLHQIAIGAQQRGENLCDPVFPGLFIGAIQRVAPPTSAAQKMPSVGGAWDAASDWRRIRSI
jgi:hypothetical protein